MRFPKTKRHKLITLLAACVGVIGIFIARPASHLVRVAWNDIDALGPLPAGYVDDASRMNATEVAQVWPIPSDAAAAETQLAELLKQAQQDGRRVSIAGARHTMGGHTIYPGGVVIDMLPFNRMELDQERGMLTVQAGARWEDVLKYLDARGRSVAVMQSNNSFSVGGSLSANCHGWQYGKPPIASTVDSFRLMLADGTVKRCSRDENAELFSLALGGYGLFGVILDVDLRVVPNERYRLEQFVVPIGEAIATFDRQVRDRDGVAMAYGRLGIDPRQFLDTAIINVLYDDPPDDGLLDPLGDVESVKLRRTLFRGSVGSDYGKKLRWSAEARLQPHLNQRHFTRNQLLNEGVTTFANRAADSTDVLHEYFVPREGLPAFLGALRQIIPAQGADLLNVTVRHVEADDDAFLRYADRDMFALVMLFNQSTDAAGDARMAAMTRELIDAAFAAGGRYYLPYRLHATRDQFERAYPQAKEFFELKRHYDPNELFQNEFYLKYGSSDD